MSDEGEMWKQEKARRTKGKRQRRAVSSRLFDRAQGLAEAHGLVLLRHTEVHYSLRKPDAWMIELYPGNGRIYSPKLHRGPYLDLPRPWTVLDAVKAAVKE